MAINKKNKKTKKTKNDINNKLNKKRTISKKKIKTKRNKKNNNKLNKTKLTKKNRQYGGNEEEEDRIKKFMEQSNPNIFSVMSWNILASKPFTYHGKEETTDENKTRNKKIIEYILKFKPDIILLQEVDKNFEICWKQTTGTNCYEILRKLPVDKDCKDTDMPVCPFTTAIIYNNKKFFTNLNFLLFSQDEDEYDRKNAIIANFEFIHKKHKITFSSLHLSGRKNHASKKLEEDVKKTLDEQDTQFSIYGGDFNKELSVDKEKVLHSEKKKIEEASPSEDNITKKYSTCTFDYGKTGEDKRALIDQIILHKNEENNITLKNYSVLNKECKNKDIYNNIINEYNGSDHFPIFAVYEFSN